MKWFFALNESGKDFQRYADLAKVAVYTALQKTSLQPHFIYDGGENDLTAWMRKRDVVIIKAKSFILEELKQEAKRRNNEGYWHIGAGAFLRLEIPDICSAHGFADKYVLYTDVDVMFNGEVSPLFSTLKPKYFAVAPEFFKNDYTGINSGVMLMNVDNLRKTDAKFRQFVKDNLPRLIDNSFDQGAYKFFYGRNRIARKIIGNKWDKLAIEYNWKPYWGKSENAKIIHFHGPKPYQTEMLLSDDAPPVLHYLRPMMTEAYFEYEKQWKQNLAAANQAS